METSQIISLIISVLSLCGFGYLATSFWQDRREKRRCRSKENQEREKREHQEQIREVVEQVLAPMKKSLETISEEMRVNKIATVATLRSDMKTLRDHYLRQGFADSGDKATWIELFEDYKAMGGNHFKEYVNQWRVDVESLPSQKPED